jgi:WD40 repeat protein
MLKRRHLSRFLPVLFAFAIFLAACDDTVKPSPSLNQKPTTDLCGDPLPPGAIARMGTVRLRHENYVTSVAFSPDGKTLASGNANTTILIWDVAALLKDRK